ncbi:tyrosine-type recombinase/integrase [Comamonas sp. w2-DMI]|uniref:tyrosine-type recombinase/integrase n=1 Tax=Comamonas sp. w2-DMI TaxID=3126391 RepID=UPI0032E3A8C8
MQQRHVAFDDLQPLDSVPLPVVKRRGRPRGSKVRTLVGTGQSFTTADFAFLRAHLLGMDQRRAAVRYLLHLDISTAREASAYFEALLARMESLTRADASIKEDARPTVEAAVRLILQWRADVLQFKALASTPATIASSTPKPAPAERLPTLDEFMREVNMDGFSEAEVLEAYEDRYGDQLAQAKATPAVESAPEVAQPLNDPYTSKRLGQVADAIGQLYGLVSVAPVGSDTVSAWLAPALAEKVRPFGVLTLADLCNWINITGRSWPTKVKAVGKAKAHRLMMWLIDNEKSIGVELNSLIKESLPLEDGDVSSVSSVASTASAAGNVVEWQALEFGIVPIEHLDWPLRLRIDGTFRSRDNNTMGATDDADAIRRWLAEYHDSPRTLDAYSRAIECLVLWAVVEKGKGISSLVRTDLLEFKNFLRNPPPHWVQTARVTKASKHWRPLRGPLSPASVEHTMRAVSALFSALFKARYLNANAAEGLVRTKRTEITMDTTRSLSNQDIAVVGETLASMDDTPQKRRYRALLLLLQSTGLRKSEVAPLVWGDIKRARMDNNECDVWQVTFVGKGSKERVVPITQKTYQALVDHREDRKNLAKTRKLALLASLKDEEWPLIGIIDEAQAQGRDARPGDYIFDAPRVANTTGALSSARIHSIIKTFFKACALKAHELNRDPTNFERASMHWMRHTFAHQVLAASGNDLAVVKELMGHSSIAVTGIYVKANMTQRINAVQKVSYTY